MLVRFAPLALLLVAIALPAQAQQVAPEPPTVLLDAQRAERTSRDTPRVMPVPVIADSLSAARATPLEPLPELEPVTDAQRRMEAQRRVETERLFAEAKRRMEDLERFAEESRASETVPVLPAWYRPSAPGANRQSAATITVNTLAGDIDGTCGTNGADPIQDCSLRDALLLADADPAFDRIEFSVAGTIPLTSPAAFTTPVEIDGTTAPGGAHQVRIDASGTIAGIFVIGTNANNSVIRGLVVGEAGGNGIVIFDGAQGVRVVNNYIGTDPAGTDLGNAGAGVSVQDASLNIIGGPAAGEANVIGFNASFGVFLSGADATGNLIQGNYLGTNAAGANLGNSGSGVAISDAPSNTVGGAGAGEANVIGFNGFAGLGFAGVYIRFAGATGNRVLGNYIGTDAAGTNLGNSISGLVIEDASGNQIGGSAPGEGNVIGRNGEHGILVGGAGSTGNVFYGNYLGTDAAGTDLRNGLNGIRVNDGASQNLIGGAGAGQGNTARFNSNSGIFLVGVGTSGNVVKGNECFRNGTVGVGGGIVVSEGAFQNTIGGSAPGEGNTVLLNDVGISIQRPGTTGNVVLGNSVGMRVGDDPIGNGVGIFISSGASGNTVGGARPGEGNTIAFSGSFAGILIQDDGTTGNTVQGNFIGTNAAGDDLQNVAGIRMVAGPSGNTIGGAAPGEGNIIGFNQGDGIAIFSLPGFDPLTGNRILGNYIGTDATGADQGNGRFGIIVEDEAPDTVIGGVGAGNTLGFNGSSGIVVNGAGTAGARVQGNFIGTDAAGRSLPHGSRGIWVLNSSSNTIGGDAPGEGNTVGSNQEIGILVGAQSGQTATDNVIQGNFVGTNAAGANLGNASHGIVAQGASDTRIGGTTSGAGNVVGNSGEVGIFVIGEGNEIQGNFVGTNAAGADLRNTLAGIWVQNGSNNTIGGTTSGAGNVVGNNDGGGIVILGDMEPTTGNTVQGNLVGTNPSWANLGNGLYGVFVQDATNTTIGGSVPGAGNTIAFADSIGVLVHESMMPTTGNVVAGNFVGTNPSDDDLGNEDYGIVVEEASSNTIGGSAPGAGNTVGFSNLVGIQIREDTDGSGNVGDSNTVAGNFVGTNADGENLGTGFYGIHVRNTPNNLIGGTEAGAGNTVGFSSSTGIFIQGATATGNVVQGNFAGTNAAGADLRNGSVGIWVFDAPANTIGSIGPGAANTVGFNSFGILISGSQATGNAVQSNFVGTNAAGDDLGGVVGIQVQDASDNDIGRATPGAGNTVGFNFDGIAVLETGAPNTTGNTVRGNFVGTNAAGADLGNENGISVYGASENIIGGTGGTGPEGNTVRHNGTGILVTEYIFIVPQDNAVLGNSVFGNDLLGIDLTADPVGDPSSVPPDGVTPNDPDDVDAGPNGFQNHPVLTAATTGTVSYSLDSTPSTTFRIELFASPNADVSGFGEGERFLHAFEVTTDAGGDASGSVSIAGLPGVLGGDVISATATPRAATLSSFGGTSEFGPTIPIIGPRATLTGTDGYRMLAHPAGGLLDDLLGATLTQGFLGSDFPDGACSVFTYDETAGTYQGGYTCIGSQSDAIPQGTGIFAYIFEDEDPLSDGVQGGFPKALGFSGDSATPPFDAFTLTATDGPTTPPEQDGWNLLGNPLATAFDWDDVVRSGGLAGSVYVYDPSLNGGDFRVWSADTGGDLTDGVVPAMQAFFVKANAAPAGLTIPPEAVSLPNPGVYGKTTDEALDPLRFSLSVVTDDGETETSVAFVAPTEGAALGVDTRDAYRLTPGAWPRTVLSTQSVGPDAVPLALNALPLDTEGEMELPLRVVAEGHEEGALDLALTTTGALPDDWTATLVDRETGDRVEVASGETYRFSVDISAASSKTARESEGLGDLGIDLLGPLAPEASKAGATLYDSKDRFILVVSPPQTVVSTEEGPAEEGTPDEGATEFALDVVMPNPARSTASVTLSLPDPGEVTVSVYDVMGRLVGDHQQTVSAGRHVLAVPVAGLAPGAYVVRVSSPSGTAVRRMTVVR